jgi:hypothetical protein
VSRSSRSTIELEGPAQQRAARREYLAERIGWAFTAAILLAAMLGWLGAGPLSGRTRTSQDGRLSVEYSAVTRYESPAQIVIRCAKPSGSPVRIGLSRTFTDSIAVESLTPEPEAVADEGPLLVYDLRVSDSADPATLLVHYRHTSYGWVRYTVRGGDPENSPAVEITQFVFP